MQAILHGGATDAQLAAFLVALHMKGETAEELAGFARALREASVPVPFEAAPGETLLDTCGTGGDGHNTFNISTTVALVVAGCGVPVAKHGNRALSGASGSADVLEQLGVTIAATGDQAARALREAGICFLFAPAFHPNAKQAQMVRRDLKMRTVFNLLGPLSNPAPAKAQMVGAPSLDAAARIAAALNELGLHRGYVVHGDDGMDEVTLTGPTTVFAIQNGAVHQFRVQPEDFGIARTGLDTLRGGDPAQNAKITQEILNGAQGPKRDIVLVNASMALMAAGKANSYGEGVEKAAESIDTGAATEKLKALATLTNHDRPGAGSGQRQQR
jgi:anthranilate phosphoribosyltransferase